MAEITEKTMKMVTRLSHIQKFFTYTDNVHEVYGKCSLTGRDVIRYYKETDYKVWEWSNKRDEWVDISEGACKDYFNHFAQLALPKYENNIVEYRNENQ